MREAGSEADLAAGARKVLQLVDRLRDKTREALDSWRQTRRELEECFARLKKPAPLVLADHDRFAEELRKAEEELGR